MRARVEQLEKENEHCRGENRQALQRIDSLESLLRREGVPIPDRAPPGGSMLVEADGATSAAPASAS